MAQTKSLTEQLVEEVHGEAFPGRAFDIMLIVGLVSAILQVVKSCQESKQGAAKHAMSNVSIGARIALRKTIRREHPELDRTEQRQLFEKSVERLENMTDSEIDCVIHEAEETIIAD